MATKTLRWLRILAFLAIPFALFFGRPVTTCGSCMDPSHATPSWLAPTLLVLIVAGLAFLLASTLLRSDDD